MIHAVVDANVLVSGLFWDKNPGYILIFHQQGRFKMLFTAETLDELQNVLSRPKFALRLQVVESSVERVIEQFHEGELVTPAHVPEASVRDAKDRAILACAAGGNADYIVTGDQDLLVLGTYEGAQIVSPVQFLVVLGKVAGH
jgi:putative PIN family toxin of toxin-antitoxin system